MMDENKKKNARSTEFADELNMESKNSKSGSANTSNNTGSNNTSNNTSNNAGSNNTSNCR